MHEVFYIHSMRFNTLSAEKSIRQVNAIMHAVQENSPEDPISVLPAHTILDELQNVFDAGRRPIALLLARA
jgi:hypothetical protein